MTGADWVIPIADLVYKAVLQHLRKSLSHE
jgi:hypothetical protein